jgi:hypothetical protein
VFLRSMYAHNEIWPLWTVSGHYVLEYPYDMIWPL